jgi:hypothetical protein
MKKKSIIEITDRELDELVFKKLGYKNYNFVPVEECGNDSSHQFNSIDGKLDKAELKFFDRWEQCEFVHYSNGTVLNKLCADGHIEKGDYVVTVCW